MLEAVDQCLEEHPIAKKLAREAIWLAVKKGSNIYKSLHVPLSLSQIDIKSIEQSLKKFAEALAEREMAQKELEKKLAEALAALNLLSIENQALKNKLYQVLNSKSWKITEPLRRVYLKIKNLRGCA